MKVFLAKLRDILASKRGTDVFIDVKSNTAGDAKKIQTYVLMTGCRAEIERRDKHFIIHVTGSPCCI